MTTAFQYVQQNGGIDSEDAYPYVGQVRPPQCAALCWFLPLHGFVFCYCILPPPSFFPFNLETISYSVSQADQLSILGCPPSPTFWRSHVAHVVLEHTVSPKTTMNSSYLELPRAGVTGLGSRHDYPAFLVELLSIEGQNSDNLGKL